MNGMSQFVSGMALATGSSGIRRTTAIPAASAVPLTGGAAKCVSGMALATGSCRVRRTTAIPAASAVPLTLEARP